MIKRLSMLVKAGIFVALALLLAGPAWADSTPDPPADFAVVGVAAQILDSPVWSVNAHAAGGYASQATTDAAGEDIVDFVPTGITGVEFWRDHGEGTLGWGFSLDAAALPDDRQQTPRLAPGAGVRGGTRSVKAFADLFYDGQARSPWTFAFGMSKTF